MIKSKKNAIELLAPAGSMEKMRYAIHFGADAVYAGVPDLSMRARINNFTEKNLAEATAFVQSKGKKMYITLNIYAHNTHLKSLERHIKLLKKIKVDALIISDPGIIYLVKKIAPEMEIHLSTQANTTNWMAAKFWYEQGVKRIVLAREVTLQDIQEIHAKVPKLELEYFVHGAMCMSYSGRCILSKWMTGTSANLGDCSQPCRWGYIQKSPNEKAEEGVRVMEVEDIRGEHTIELEQDTQGTYFFNSKDLNLMQHLKQLKDAGVMSFKIEGRNKSVSYVAQVTRAYRAVLDALESGVDTKKYAKIVKEQSGELDKIMNRGYTKGFLLGNEPEHNFFQSHSNAGQQFVGEVLQVQGTLLEVKVHNAIYGADTLEIFTKEKNVKVAVRAIYDDEMHEVASAHGGHHKHYFLRINKKGVEPLSLIKKII